MIDLLKRVPVKEQDPAVRINNFDEVCLGYTDKEAILEASRCLNCKNPQCVLGCPVKIDIPSFINKIKQGEFLSAYNVIRKNSSLPAICGRVCPQESQCESKCVRKIKGEAINIGKLERFCADFALNSPFVYQKVKSNGLKVAIIGSGPSGLACASELSSLGYDVTIFEALHEYGGVLVYGIPEFRLPKKTVVKKELERLSAQGVNFEKNTVVGKSITIDELINDEGFSAVFIGSGAGLPNFLNIKGENLNGVFSANEFLTRTNLMSAYLDNSKTPIIKGGKVIVIGGGNVAMDTARTAIRLGAETHIVYRRSEEELPARIEEVEHAKQEGVIFDLLTNPLEILDDGNGGVRAVKVCKMKLGEKDEKGRRNTFPIENSEYEILADSVIIAIGTCPNPLITNSTKDVCLCDKKRIIVNEKNMTTKEGVFAGGDAVTGSATVILAMEAGKKSAKHIDEYLKSKK